MWLHLFLLFNMLIMIGLLKFVHMVVRIISLVFGLCLFLKIINIALFSISNEKDYNK